MITTINLHALAVNLVFITCVLSWMIAWNYSHWVWFSRRRMRPFWYSLLGSFLFTFSYAGHSSIFILDEVERAIGHPLIPYADASISIWFFRVILIPAFWLKFYGYVSETKPPEVRVVWTHRFRFWLLTSIVTFPITYLALSVILPP